MTSSQLIGLGVLVLLAALGFWLMGGGKKIKPDRLDARDHGAPGGDVNPSD
jgi:hypothetical protein